MTRTALAALTALAAAFLALTWAHVGMTPAASVAPAAHLAAADGPTDADPAPAPAIAAEVAADVFLMDLNNAGIHGDTADETVTLGQQVCEGVAAAVPVPVMVSTVAARQGWTTAQATYFVDSARAAFCMAHGTVTLDR